ncbi:MAG: hypothetical protein AB7O52_14805 [Planctomycetota bacterium]
MRAKSTPRVELGVLGVLCLICASATGQTGVGVAPPPLPPAGVGQRLFFSDQTNDAVYVCQDLDGDGNANGPGELAIYYDASSPEPDLQTPRFVAVAADGVLYVGDSNADFILRLEDLDGDGDANDPGEASIYYDTLSGGPLLVSINNMVLDAQGSLFFSDNGTAAGTERHVTRIQDVNGDGYCSFADGEVLAIYQFATTTGVLIERPSALAFDVDGTLLVSDYETDNVLRLVDTNGDGDANDAGEQLPYFTSGTLLLNFSESMAFGVAAGGARPLYVNGGPVLDAIFAFRDSDADGVIANPLETRVFWDLTQVDGVIPGVALRVAAHPSGALFVAEGGQTAAGVGDAIVVLEDLDTNGDANGVGEARNYVDNANAAGIVLGQPMSLAFEPSPPLPGFPHFVRGDCNDDAQANIADAVFLLGFLFPGPGGAPVIGCDDACDTNDDETLNIADAVALLGSLFGLPTVPLPPPTSCGEDPDAALGGALGCGAHLSCPQP